MFSSVSCRPSAHKGTATGLVPSPGIKIETDSAARLAYARAFGFRIVETWWSALVAVGEPRLKLRALIQPFEMAKLPESARRSADDIAMAAVQLEPEEAAYRIGVAYSKMLHNEYRSRFGIYYTPPSLTSRLVQQATEAGVDWVRCRVLDPACGGGAFLAPVASRMIRDLNDRCPLMLIENIAKRLRGFEIDPFAGWLAQVTLDAILLDATRRAGQRLPLVVSIRDSLKINETPHCFDLVIGNPPYGRVSLNLDDRIQFKRSLYGHANMYGLFTDIALRHTTADGVVAFVTPTSFLSGEYFKNLRALLGQDAQPVTIDLISARKGVFEDVLQEILLATYRRGRQSASISVNEITLANGAEFVIRATGKASLPEDRSQPWILPRHRQQAWLVAQLTKMNTRLSDWGYAVSTGPLVWNRHKSQIAAKAGPNRYPLIWAEAVTPDGGFLWRAEKKNHLPWFEIRSGDNWLITRRLCVLLQRTTAKEQQRRLIAASLPAEFLERHGAVVIENHLNMVRPIVERPPVAPQVLAAFLNSAAADQTFRCVSGSVAVSAYELESMPLPASPSLKVLSQLVRTGARRDRIEAECARLYEKAF
jgi:adenine-specific DNA-methyltransferase